jgi:hypothetical protein
MGKRENAYTAHLKDIVNKNLPNYSKTVMYDNFSHF